MAGTPLDFASILVQRGVLTAEQLAEARDVQCRNGEPLEVILVRLGYATAADIALALAEADGLPFFDLTGVTIPARVIELVPESVARENIILPLACDEGALWMVVSDPRDTDTLEKLEFILNKPIRPVVALRGQIIEAISRHYGHMETESVDSMLAECTDAAIDSTETEVASLGDMDMEEDAADTTPSPSAGRPRCKSKGFSIDLDALQESLPHRRARESATRAGLPVERQATVRYYERMHPDRLFPLFVILSRKAIQAVVQRGVAQAQSGRFRVEAGSLVEVEPVLPGCGCYPPKEQVRVDDKNARATFWVVPHVLGKLSNARVLVRQEGRVLGEMPLNIRVGKQTLAVLLGALGLVLPFVLLLLKHYRLDFESQLDDGFGVYARAAQLATHRLTPEALAAGLVLAAVAAYFWLRPRRRDLFWDVAPAEPEGGRRDDGLVVVPREDGAGRSGDAAMAAVVAEQVALLARAEDHFARHDFATAALLYDAGLALGKAGASHYHHASLAAYQAGNPARALAVLRDAEANLRPSEMSGVMWYNMGCFATRLGQFDHALHYLNRAIDAGVLDPDKYQQDPDLAPLRWRSEFKHLVRSLRQAVAP
jgi:hypothetical protein